MTDYFMQLKKYVKNKYVINSFQEILYNINIDNILGFNVNTDVKYIYDHYKEFDLSWFDSNDKYIGEIHFVSFNNIQKQHNELIEIMIDCYDVEMDEFDIVRDIYNWYPLFNFLNGDALCLDVRDEKVVFYDHEIYDIGKNLHGLTIAKSINDLFEKWSSIHFANVYYWDEIVNDEGIDINSKLAKKYLVF